MSGAAPADTRDTVLTGILLATFAYFIFSVHDAAVKILVATIPVWQVLFFRSITILTGCLAFGGPRLFIEAASSPIVRPMFLRSFLILTAWLCYYAAARDLQLAELTTVYFAAPVIITVLSVVILKETVPLFRWVAVFVGFLGVFIACDPTRLGLSWPMLLVIAAAFLWAMSMVLMRKIALREKTIVQMILNNSFFLVTAGLPLVYLWQSPSLGQTALLFGAGLLAGLAQFCLFEGMKRAQASVIAPFEYTSLVWSFLLGYAIWSDVPRREVFVGAALIMAAGLAILAHERFRKPG